jgi:hypothetical protein
MKTNLLILATLIILTQGDGQWIQTAGPMAHRDVPMFAVFTTGETLIVGCYRGGAYLSTNNAVSWEERSNGLPWDYEYTDVYDFLVEGNWLIAGTGDGVYRSSTFGELWLESNTGLPSSLGIDMFVKLTGLISGGTGVGLYSSTDNGESWFADTIGLYRGSTGAVTYIWALAAIGLTRFAGTANGVSADQISGRVKWLFFRLGRELWGTSFVRQRRTLDSGKFWTSGGRLRY